MDARITRISIAPVKGLGLQHPEAVAVGPAGVPENRRLHLVNVAGGLVNGKTEIRLMLVSARLDLEAGTLALGFPDGSVVEGPLERGARDTTIFFGRPVTCRELGGPFSAALSAFAGITLRLMMSDDVGAAGDRGDEYAVSIVSSASVEDVGAHGGVHGLDARRFRMLFEVDGVEPYAEDTWIGREVRLGDVVVRPVGNIGRCVITTCDPDTTRKDFDTLKVLASYRREIETTEPLPLGVAGTVIVPGTVRVGDPVSLV